MAETKHGDVLEVQSEHFLPIGLHDLIDSLLAVAQPEAREPLRRVCELYVQLFHSRLRPSLDRLKRAYAPLRPDEDVLDLTTDSKEERLRGRDDFLEELDHVLEQANYARLTTEHLDHALTKTSPHGLEVSVNLADYQVLRLYTRGCGLESAQRRHWRSAYTRKVTTETPTYRRLFLAISLEPDELYLKLFRDVPESDLEMLLPNTRVRIRAFDKVKLGVTGGGGVIGGAFSTITKFSATVNPVTACLAIAGLGAVLWRQVAGVLAQRTKYMAALQGKLYFHSLDNNQGALTHLVELAGEEECKEALLAYAFLNRGACEREQLDEQVESYLRETFHIRADYEVSDGLRKLRECGLLLEGAGGALSVFEPKLALERLTRAWIELAGGADQVSDSCSGTARKCNAKPISTSTTSAT